MTGADERPASPEPVEVELRLFAMVRETVGRKTFRRSYREPPSVRSVLADLEASTPELQGALLDGAGQIQSSVTVVLNGRHISHFDGPETTVDDGDTVGVMPPVSGGGLSGPLD